MTYKNGLTTRQAHYVWDISRFRACKPIQICAQSRAADYGHVREWLQKLFRVDYPFYPRSLLQGRTEPELKLVSLQEYLLHSQSLGQCLLVKLFLLLFLHSTNAKYSRLIVIYIKNTYKSYKSCLI